METSGRTQGIWTREKAERAVATCTTFNEFCVNHPRAYKAVHRHQWRDLLSALPRSRRPNNFWTVERISVEALKYPTRSAFVRGQQSTYHAAHRAGLLEVVCSHMERKTKGNGYWTRERVLEEAKKYHSRSEFMAGACGAYAAATRDDYLDDACAHMEIVGSLYKRAIYAIEFEDNSVYVGLTFNYDVRYRAHLTQDEHIGTKLRKVPHKFKPFKRWLTLDRAGRAGARTIESYRRRGWTILNRMKAGGMGSRPEKWSYEEVRKLAAR